MGGARRRAQQSSFFQSLTLEYKELKDGPQKTGEQQLLADPEIEKRWK